MTRITCFPHVEIQCSSATAKGHSLNWTLRMVTRSSCCECLTSPIYFTSQTPRTEWVLKWPGQIVIAGCQTHWTKEVSEALVENKIDELYKALMAQVPTTVVEAQTSLPSTLKKKEGIGGQRVNGSRQLEHMIFFSEFPFFLPVKNLKYPNFHLSGLTTRFRTWREKLYHWRGFRDSGFALFGGRDSGLKVRTGCGTPKITIGITRISENWGRDEGIEEHYWPTTGDPQWQVQSFVTWCGII